MEDAYYTFRVLDNFVNGYGLRWNIDERVQSYTNPLWLFLHIPFYYLTKEIYLTSTYISLSIALSTIYFLARRFETNIILVFSCFFLPLILSRSYLEHVSSGLELPLTFLFQMIFASIILQENHKKSVFWGFFIASLSAVNRLDTLLLYIPSLAFLAIRERSLKPAILGMLPIILWLSFSLFYYGFLFPNTKYAKLDTEIPLILYLKQGGLYALEVIINDLPTAFIIISGIIITIYLSIKSGYKNFTAFGAGALIYSLYIIYIGGDYMSGKYWALPFFHYILLWIFLLSRADSLSISIFGITLITSWFIGIYTKDEEFSEKNKIKPEIKRLKETFSLGNPSGKDIKEFPWSNTGLFHRKKALEEKNKNNFKYVFVASGGLMPFYSGPDVIVIDKYGLGDALLARLPVNDTKKLKIGHNERIAPEGYPEYRRLGSEKNMDPSLAIYYKKLRLITSGRLMSPERLLTIIFFNLGYYDHYRDDYVKRAIKPLQKK